MEIKKAIIPLLALTAILVSGSCNYSSKSFNGFTIKMARRSLIDKYPKLPTEEILRQETGSRLYDELKERYKQSLSALEIETDRDGAKLVMVIMSPDVGRSLSLSNTYGVPFIVQTCNVLGIDCLDLSSSIAVQNGNVLTMGPNDGNWSKTGAAYISEQLSYLLLGYDCFKNTKPFPAGPKPEAFGDQEPNKVEVIEADKDVQYHVSINSQGLRMGHNVTFPKTKQTILFMGGATLFCPNLDDKMTSTYLLQEKYPNKEIINAGYLNYTIEDYLSLYYEKARYTEPDIVVVCTDGDEILDYFFTQRNRFSRLPRIYKPTDVEREFYELLN